MTKPWLDQALMDSADMSSLHGDTFKGTLSVISLDSSCQVGNVRFTMVPLTVLAYQVWIKNECL